MPAITRPAAPPDARPEDAVAALPLLHGAMLLSGFGTVFLGPVLPVLSAAVGARDAGAGLFFAAQFVGSFFGGITTSRPLWRSLLRGCIAATFGFACLAIAVLARAPFAAEIAALLPLGFGVGQMLTSLNLLASQRYATGRSSALAKVNLSWGLGAVLAPLLLGQLLPHFALGALFAALAVCYACVFGAAVWNRRAEPCGVTVLPADVHVRGLSRGRFLFFAALLFIYGGTETSFSGWLTTFAQRYGSGVLQTSTVGVLALWMGIVTGHALVPPLLRVVRERTLLTGCLVSAAIWTTVLSQSTGTPAIAAVAALLGMSLAPWFPLVLSTLLGEGSSARETGTIIAVSGLGAASLPLGVGRLSSSSGSLRVALLVPLCGLIALLCLSLRRAPAAKNTAQDLHL